MADDFGYVTYTSGDMKASLGRGGYRAWAERCIDDRHYMLYVGYDGGSDIDGTYTCSSVPLDASAEQVEAALVEVMDALEPVLAAGGKASKAMERFGKTR